MYIPLYVKSNYSILSSMLTVDDIVSFATENKLEAIAINDNNMFATMEFIKKCQLNGIKPIISLSLIYDDSEIILFAKNNKGYHSLMKLSTINSKEKISKKHLESYRDGVLLILPFKSYYLYDLLNNIYNDSYIGYTTKEEEIKVKMVTNNIIYFREALYLKEEDKIYLNYLYLIRDGKTVLDKQYYELENHELYFKPLEISKEGIDATYFVANLCNITMESNKLLLPTYKDTKDLDPDSYLLELSKKGLAKRLLNNVTMVYHERLMYELNIIKKMGFSNYFLVVYDFIKYAKKNNILVGPGRGSAAGSLVSYSLGITDIDPIKYDLLFERFLNPSRMTMPDIDTDFPDNKREEVISYVISKYGEKNVSGIITFGTLGMKQVLRDTARILNIPLYKIEDLSRYMPNSRGSLEKFYQKTPAFRAKIDMDNELTKMFKIAKRLEGYPRHTSSHAAGIVICEYPLDEVIPLTYSDNMYLSSYTNEYLEKLGLLKMDFLGLKNLTLISNIIDDVRKNHNINITFSNIPLDDIYTLNLFTKANTSGIFQFESNGMRNFLTRLQPKTLEDIFAAIALYRPGPSDNIDLYIKRKNNLESIEYPDPCLEKVLNNTYGIIIYQEQIIQVANIFAGYSLGDADILRKAMSKKEFDILKGEEEKFITKSIEKGHDRETAKEIFDLILKFAGYGFNRAHSVAYSLIAYKMAFLKVHYQSEFFSNLLSNVIGSEVKTKEYIREVRKNSIKIDKPDINLSNSKYIINNGVIIYPFSNIKKIGSVASNIILKARGELLFTDIYDAFSRLVINGIQKQVLESLIYADCFRKFSYNKNTLLNNLDSLYNYAELTKDLDPSFVAKPEIIEYQEFDSELLLKQEKESFGFYLTHHPTTIYHEENKNIIPLCEIRNYFDRDIDTIVLIDRARVVLTKKGDKMQFITGSDENGVVEYTIFPRVFNLYPNITKGDILKIRGTVERRLQEVHIIAKKIEKLNHNGD